MPFLKVNAAFSYLSWGPALAAEGFAPEDAQAEADENRTGRVQALVATLDKAKLFLRRQPREIRVRPALLHQKEGGTARLLQLHSLVIQASLSPRNSLAFSCCNLLQPNTALCSIDTAEVADGVVLPEQHGGAESFLSRPAPPCLPFNARRHVAAGDSFRSDAGAGGRAAAVSQRRGGV